MHPVHLPPQRHDNDHAAHGIPLEDDDEDLNLSQYKVMTVSAKGFQSAEAPPSPLQEPVTTTPNTDPIPDEKDGGEKDGDVDYELVVNENGVSSWVAKTVHRLPVTKEPYMGVPTFYADPFGGRATNGQAVRNQNIEDGHTHDHYVDMYGTGLGLCEERGLIVVAGEESTATRNTGVVAYMPHHLST